MPDALSLDEVFISDLRLRTIVGINPEERVNRQDVVINIVLFTSTERAAGSDQIEDAVNYKSICKRVISLVEESSYHLVEKLTEEVARACIEDERVRRVRVTLEKPGALRFADSVGIRIERDREQLLG